MSDKYDLYFDLEQHETIKSDEVWHGEMKNRRKDGSTSWFKVRVHPELNKRGRKIGYIAVRQDITASKEMELLASQDPLTKIYNRSKFNDFVAHEISMFKRYKTPSTLVLCDVDHFKQINDLYGHPAGDKALIVIANGLTSNVRESVDLVARYGGEEFALLLIETGLKEAHSVAKRLKKL